MNLQELIHTCSGTYLFDLPLAGREGAVKRFLKTFPVSKRTDSILCCCLVQNKRVVTTLLAAGFRKVSTYNSYAHGGRLVGVYHRARSPTESETKRWKFPKVVGK